MATKYSATRPPNDSTNQIKQELIENLNVLYGDNAQHKPQQFAAANKFLMEFNQHSDAWSICLSILSEVNNSNISILRFSSQTIYDGLLENWRTVTVQDRVQIVRSLQNFIRSFCDKYLLSYLSSGTNSNQNMEQKLMKSSFKFILNKICQSVAFLALNAKEAPNMIQSVLNSCANIQMPQQLTSLWVNFEILNAFALEFEQQHVSHTIINETRNILTNKYRESLLKSITFALHSAKLYENTLFRLMEIAFATLKHWINIVDITLEGMQSVGLLQEILHCIQLLYKEREQMRAKQFIVEAMDKVIIKGIVNKSQQAKYDEILSKICATYATLQWNENDVDNTQNVCNLICGFCENSIDFIAKGDDVCLKLIEMILRFTSHSSTIITTETFGFWSRLQDIAMNKRHKFLQKDVYIELLRALLLHSSDAEEFDEHGRFRQNSSEIFISIYFVLQKEYFIEIGQRCAMLFAQIRNAAHNELDSIYIGIESCVFALNIIAQEVADERQEMEQCLALNIKPMCEMLLKLFSGIKKEINATIFHLVAQITSLLRGYSFYICSDKDLLSKCLLFNIEIATKYSAIVAFECSKTFNSLLYHSTSIWLQHLGDFEQHIVSLVTQQIGNGQILYNKLTITEKELLKQSDVTITDPIVRQHAACAVYYESLCMIIDVYHDANRQKSLIDHLLAAPIKICTQIASNCTTATAIDANTFYSLLCNLRIFCGAIRGLKTTKSAPHPLASHMTNMLNICSASSKLNVAAAGFDANALYDAVCDVIESLLDTLGSSSGTILNNLVQISLDILKSRKSESSARILKKMVSTFSNERNLNDRFIKLIDECVVWLQLSSSDDLRAFHPTVAQIFECVQIIIDNDKNNENKNYIWNQMVPNTCALSLKLLTAIHDRDGLKSAAKILKNIFDTKHAQQFDTKQFRECVLPNVISVLFNGIALHFERMVANKVYDIYYNLMQFDPQYVKEHTMKQLVNLNKVAAFRNNDENKKLFLTAFWAQRSNKRKFNLVMTTFYSVCRNFNTVDSFAGIVD